MKKSTIMMRFEELRSQGFGLNDASRIARKEHILNRIEEADDLDSLKECLLDFLKRLHFNQF